MLLKWPNPAGDASAETETTRDPAAQMRAVRQLRRAVAIGLSVASVVWLVLTAQYVGWSVGWANVGLMLPHELAMVVLAGFVPPLFAWLAGFWFWRSSDADQSRAALHQILADMAFPNPEAEARLNAMALSLRRISQSLEAETSNALERVDNLDGRLGRNVEVLQQAVATSGQQSETVLRELETRAEVQRRLLGEISSLDSEIRALSERQGVALSQAVAEAGRRTAEIEASLRVQLVAADDTVDQVSRKAQQVATTLEQPMARLREEVDSTVRRVAGVSQELRNRIEALSQMVGRTMNQSESLREGIESQIGQLRDSLGSAQTAVQQMIAASRHELEALDGAAERSQSTAEAAAARIADQGASLARMLDTINVGTGEAEQGLLSAGESARAAAEQFAAEVQALADRNLEVAARSEQASSAVMQAAASFSAADRQLAGVADRLESGRHELDATVAHMSGSIAHLVEDAEERLRGAASLAVASSERSDERLSAVAGRLRDLVAGLQRDLTAIEQQALAVAARGDGQVESLAARATELTGVLTEIEGAIGRGSMALTGVSDQARQSLQAVRDGIEAAGDRVRQMDADALRLTQGLAGAETHLADSGARVRGELESLEQTVEQRSEALERLTGRVRATVDEVESGVAARLENVAQRTEQAGTDTEARLAAAAGQMQTLVTGLQRDLALIEQQAMAVAARGDGQVESLACRATELTGILTEIEGAIGRGSMALSGVSDQAQQSLQAVQQGIEAAGDTVRRLDADSVRLTQGLAGAEAQLADSGARVRGELETLQQTVEQRSEALERLTGRVRATVEEVESGIAERLQSVAQHAEQTSIDAEARLTAAADQIATAMDQVLAQTADARQTLSAAAAEGTGAAGAMSERSAELMLLLQDIERAVNDTGQSLSGIEQRGRGLIEGLTDSLGARIGDLGAQSDQVRMSVDGVSAMLQERAQTLSALSGQIAETADRTGVDVAAQLTDVAGNLDRAAGIATQAAGQLAADSARMAGESEQMASLIGGAADTMEQRLQLAAAAADRAASQISERTAEIGLLAGDFDASVRQAGEGADAYAERLGLLLSRLDTAGEAYGNRMLQLMAALQDAGDALTARSDETTARNNALAESFRLSVQALADDGNRISDLLQALREQVDERADELGPRLDGMAAKVSDASALAGMMIEALESGSGALTTEAESVQARLTGLADDLDRQIRGLDTAADAVTTRVIGAAGEIELRTTSLGDLGQRITDETLQRAADLTQQVEELASRVDRSEAVMRSRGEAIEQISARSTDAARAATMAIGEATGAIEAGLLRSTDLEHAAGRLADAAGAARDRLGDATEATRAMATDLSAESARLADETRTLMEAAAAGAGRLATALSTARSETERFSEAEQVALSRNAALLDSLQQRAGELENLSARLGDTGRTLDGMLAARMTGLEQAGAAADAAGQRFDGLVQSGEQRLQAGEQRMQAAGERLQQQASTLDAAFREAEQTLEQAAQALGAGLDTARRDTVALGADGVAVAERLQAALDQVRSMAASTGAETATTIETLEQQRQGFDRAIGEAREAVSAAEDLLRTQSGAIASASQAASMQSGLAAKAFEVQATRLEKAAGSAARAAVEMRDRAAATRDRRFLQSASVVSEGLNGLALDLHRLIDAEATEKELKRFYRGDRGLFARRLVARDDRRRIRDLYEAGGDFYRSTDLYLSEFESLLTLVENTDTEGLLSSVFLSADVGKLYLLLCDALDRAPVGARKRRSA